MVKKKNRKKQKTTVSEILFTVITFTLAVIFWVGGSWHSKLYNLSIHLHFCDHHLCLLFAIIWTIFTLVGLYYMFKEKEMHIVWAVVFAVVLVIGIFFMNIYNCENVGAASSGGSSSGTSNGQPIGSPVPNDLPMSTCTDTDGGNYPEVKGKIVEVPIWDKCKNDYLLEEFVCLSSKQYGSYQYDCRTYFNNNPYACCSGGICTLDCDDIITPPEPEPTQECGETYPSCNGYCSEGYICNSFNYPGGGGHCICLPETPATESNCNDRVDNDNDGYTDCDDRDCDCEYTCTDSSYPSCAGTCPYGEICRGKLYTWGYGCGCLSGEDGNDNYCYETDRGDDPLEPGTTYSSSGTQKDYCSSDMRTLYEYYCAGNFGLSKAYSCGLVCENCCCIQTKSGGKCGSGGVCSGMW